MTYIDHHDIKKPTFDYMFICLISSIFIFIQLRIFSLQILNQSPLINYGNLNGDKDEGGNIK